MKNYLSQPVYKVFSTAKQDGPVFGIEIECNLRKLDENVYKAVEYEWKVEKDGSLKKNGIEFVSAYPKNKAGSLERVNWLRDFIYGKWRNIIEDSQKAGTHIHLNVNDLTGLDIFKFLLIYYPLETVITNRAGPGRAGNLFCLRLRDATIISEALYECIDRGSWKYIMSDDYRYSALNLQSLAKYGTLEIRSIRTDPMLDNIEVWLDLLIRLRNKCKEIEDPWDEIIKISGLGPTEWARSILGDELFNHFKYDTMDEDIYEDMQLIQIVAKRLSKELKNA